MSQRETPLLDPPEDKPSTTPSRPAVPPPVQYPTGQVRRVLVRRRIHLRELLSHYVLLCLRPEQWAQALKYPLWVSLVTVLLTAIIVAGALGIAQGRSMLQTFTAFAAQYDQNHPRMELANGQLTVESVPGKTIPRYHSNQQTWVIEPSPINQVVWTIKPIFFGEKKNLPIIFQLDAMKDFDEDGHYGQVHWIIDSTHLSEIARKDGVILACGVAACSFAVNLLSQLLWTLINAFLVCSAVMVGARELHLRKRVAYRIACAIMVPLMFFDGILKVAGYSPVNVFGPEFTLIFWFFLAGALAFWAGHLANQQFKPVAAKH